MTAPHTRIDGRPPGTRPDPAPRRSHDRPGLLGPERLLLQLADAGLERRALRAAALLVHQMDLEARERARLEHGIDA